MLKPKKPNSRAFSQFRYGGDIATSLGRETELKGVLAFTENLKICGKFSGTIQAKGSLYIEKGAHVEAEEINVSSLVLAGTLIGSIQAVDSVELVTGAVLKGNISAARLNIADGVIFEGQCQMTGISDDIDIFSRPSEDLKNELLQKRTL